MIISLRLSKNRHNHRDSGNRKYFVFYNDRIEIRHKEIGHWRLFRGKHQIDEPVKP